METLYKITNKINNRYYIGSTNNYEFRMKSHIEKIGYFENHQELYLDFLKYGTDVFIFEKLYESEDKIEVSRMESKTIRENMDDPLIYNNMKGASGRRVLREDDIIFIRDLYAKKELYIFEAYDKYYKNIITFRAFKKAWHGDTFKDIHYDVYTPENKKWHFSKGQSRQGEVNRSAIYTEEEVLDIRRRRDNGESRSEVRKIYPKGTKECFYSIWNNKNWKHLL